MRIFFAFVFIFTLFLISPAWGQPIYPTPSQTPPTYSPAYPYRLVPNYPGNSNSSSVGRPDYRYAPYYGGQYPYRGPSPYYDPNIGPYPYRGIEVDENSAVVPGP